MPEPDAKHLARAKIIALAFARTAEYHRKTSLLAGVVALCACGLAW